MLYHEKCQQKINLYFKSKLLHLSYGNLQVGSFIVELTTDIYVRCNRNDIFKSHTSTLHNYALPLVTIAVIKFSNMALISVLRCIP